MILKKIYIHIQAYINTYRHTYIYTYIHTYIHTHIRNTYIHNTYILTYIHTYIWSIHDIPLVAFGYETLSDKKIYKDNRSLLKTIQYTTENSVKYYIHSILVFERAKLITYKNINHQKILLYSSRICLLNTVLKLI
jgi:hypothetical protein